MEKKDSRLNTLRLMNTLQNNSVGQIELQFKDGAKFIVDSEIFIKLLVDTLVIGIESEQHKDLVREFGDFQERLENTHEYKVAMQLENDLNNMCFNNDNFVKCLPLMHRTLQQNALRLFRDSFIYMASLDERYIDGRNRGAYETSKKVAEILKKSSMPFI